jgi:hypothetical protein
MPQGLRLKASLESLAVSGSHPCNRCVLLDIPASFDSPFLAPWARIEQLKTEQRPRPAAVAVLLGQFIDGSPSPLNESFRDFSIIFPGLKGLGLPVRFSRKLVKFQGITGLHTPVRFSFAVSI